MKSNSLFIILFIHLLNLSAQTMKIDSLLSIMKSESFAALPDTVKMDILRNLHKAHNEKGEIEKSTEYGKEAIKFFKEDTPKVIMLLDMAGFAYNKEALIFAKEALALSEKLQYKKGTIGALQHIGNLYSNQSDYSLALEAYMKEIKVIESTENKNKIASPYIGIGNVLVAQGNFDKALEYYHQGLKIVESLGEEFKSRKIIFYLNMGGAYFGKKDFDKSLDCFTIVLSIIREKDPEEKDDGLFYWRGEAYSGTGDVYFEKENYGQALTFYTNALQQYYKIGMKQRIASTLNNISNIDVKMHHYNEAIKNFNTAILLARETNAKEPLQMAYNGLSQAYAFLQDYRSAYENYKLYSAIKDSIFNEESIKQITEMQTKYETEKKEHQIKLLNKDKEIQAKDLERQKTIRNAVAGGLLLVLFFSFVLINRLLLIRKQKKVIEVEREKSEKLLLNILPKETADELKLNNKVVPKSFEMVTVMFTDFKGFTTIAEKMSAEELVSELDFIFKKFDNIISKYPIEKIKTIGDAYMCAGGLPVANSTNPLDVVMAALEIQEFMKVQNKWQLRLGIHTGSVIAGVVGDKKFAYDIWGDTVNTASRMESSGEAGKVNISGTTYKMLVGATESVTPTEKPLWFTFRGKIPAKNKGEIEMYFVEKL